MHLVRRYIKVLFFFIILLIPHTTDSQTNEKASSIASDVKEYNLAESKDSTFSNQQSGVCIPQCREGYMCSNGECISKCNPPCPANMKCGNDGDCHEVFYKGSSDSKKQANLISSIKRVGSADEVIQGFVIKTNRHNSEVQIGNTNFSFDNELYLLAPAREYRIILNAKGQNTKYVSTELEPGHFEEIKMNLRPVRLNFGVSCGLGFFKKSVGPLGIFDLGMTIASKHFFGITGNIFMEDDTTIVHNTTDSLIQRHQATDFCGFGATYGYAGFHLKRICMIPKLSIGYWKADEIDERLARYDIDSTSRLSLNTIDKMKSERYFFKPGIEIQFGYNLFGFRINSETYMGEGIGPFGISFGIILRIL